MSKTTVEVSPGPTLPTTFTALIQQPSTPTPSTTPPVGLVEIETAAELIPGPQGPIGPVGPPGPQGSPDTGGQILTKLAPVDGAGSGLDADLLDGQHGSYYAAATASYDKATADSKFVDVAGDVMTGPLVLTGVSTAPLASPGSNTSQIASTAFVAAAVAAQATASTSQFVDTAGDTMTGLLTLSGDPSTNLQASTKQYVDVRAWKEAPNDGTQYVRQSLTWSPVSVPPGTAISDTPPAGPLQAGQLWWQSSSGGLFIWYIDPNTSQWVQVNYGPSTKQGPTYVADEQLVAGQPATPISYTGIASWATEVGISLGGLQTGGTVVPEVRIGSGSLLNSGYSGYGINQTTAPTTVMTANTGGWKIGSSWASTAAVRGVVMLRRRGSANLWLASGTLERTDSATVFSTVLGQVSLSGPIDRIGLASGDGWTTGAISAWYR